MQNYTSQNTSINRTKLPAVFRKADFRSRMVMDYGSGRYTDHIKEYLNGIHKDYLPYDPYNQPEERNNASVRLVINAMHRKLPVDVVCSNVLNVIDDPETIQKIAHHIEDITARSGGTGYITVYEGNRSEIGKQTGPDQFQRNEPLRAYLKYFRNATIKNGMIVINC